jgi:putative endonuclease
MKKQPLSGELAEQLACKLLRKHGLKIRARNFKTPLGEIDIIAEDRNTLVIVEVRLRNNLQFGTAEESITTGKQRRILRATQIYLQREKIDSARPCRFDAICLGGQNAPTSVKPRWIKNAFGGGDTW